MKCLTILMSILLIGSFSLIPIFASTEDEEYETAAEEEELTQGESTAGKDITDVNSIADANAVSDANAVKSRIRAFEGLERALQSMDKEGQKEMREWTLSDARNRLDLAKAVQEQVIAELNFLRELAVDEGAVKTTAAIDGLLVDRQERFGKVIKRMENESEKVRLRSERRNLRREREPRRREREGGRRTRERPSRRERDTE